MTAQNVAVSAVLNQPVKAQRATKIPAEMVFRTLSELQKNVFSWITNKAVKNIDGKTYIASHVMIAEGLRQNVGSVRNAVQRLVRKGVLVRVEYMPGRSGWTSYAVGEEYAEKHHLFSQNIVHAPVVEEKPVVVPVVEKTVQSHVLERITWACNCYGVSDYNLSINDIMDVWHTSVFGDVEHLVMSIEHIMWYLRNGDSQSITKPKAWVISKLRRGYYAAPVGFESEQEKCLREILEDLRKKKAHMDKIQEEVNVLAKYTDSSCDAWLASLDENERKKILNTDLFSSVFSSAANAMLRQAYVDMQKAA